MLNSSAGQSTESSAWVCEVCPAAEQPRAVLCGVLAVKAFGAVMDGLVSGVLVHKRPKY